MKKIFGIGLQKTGCTTFLRLTGDILEYKYAVRTFSEESVRSMSEEDKQRIRQNYVSQPLLSMMKLNQEDKWNSLLEKFEGGYKCVFGDYPIFELYKELYEKFGEKAKFVFFRRKHLWQYAKTVSFMQGAFWNRMISDNFKGRVENYVNHNQAVRDYFSGKDNFIEICWEEETNGERYCGFLDCDVLDGLESGIPVYNETKPKHTPSPIIMERHVEKVKNKLISWGYDPEASY